MKNKNLSEISHLITSFWGEALEGGSPHPEWYVSKRVAEHYALRAEMDGEVIKASGEVVARDSI